MHVDLAQPYMWTWNTLKLHTKFLAELDVWPLGLSLTQASIQAIAQTLS